MKEEDEIFSSKIFLTFKSKRINKLYHIRNQRKINIFNKISFSLLGILSITLNALILEKGYPKNVPSPSKTELFYYIFLVGSLITTVCDVVFLVFSFTLPKKTSLQLVLSCVSYCFITVEFTILKGILEVLYLYDVNEYFFVNIIDYLIRVMAHYSGIVEFIQSIPINIILSAMILCLYYLVDTLNSIISDSGTTFIILNIGLIVSCYFITQTSKRNFFYFYEIKELNQKKDSILNNLNTGYLRIQNDEIKFMNIALINTMKNTTVINNAFYASNNNLTTNSTKYDLEISDEWLYEQKEIIFDLLFGGLTIQPRNSLPETTANDPVPSPSQPAKLKVSKIDKIKISNPFLKELAKYYSTTYCLDSNPKLNLHGKNYNVFENSKFVFIDYQNLILSNEKRITYEISFRYDSNEFEFVFNDITRTREFEHKEYDIKLRNIFLTKIAHEFKNPLVSIQELTKQIKDMYNSDANLNKITDLANTYCEYLLILIKDLDFFSIDNRAMARNSKVVCEKVNLEDLMNFCVVNGKRRLKLLQKENSVELCYKIAQNVPKDILSDDSKLKQILINLLSNSIKFTFQGKIMIDIVKIGNESVRFSVIDTGIGIPKSRQQNLLDCKELKSDDKGIGLTIVKELTSLIGEEVRFASEEKKGATFWFEVNINGLNLSQGKKKLCGLNSNNSVLNSSNSTVKIDNFNLELTSPYNKLTTSSSEKVYNIIVADDEMLARKALIRVLQSAAKDYEIKLNIMEARDGVELLYLVYENSIANSVEVDAIISDQTMVYINGSLAQTILGMANIQKKIPFFIVTAYDVNAAYFKNLKLEGIYSKPLRKFEAQSILEHCFT